MRWLWIFIVLFAFSGTTEASGPYVNFDLLLQAGSEELSIMIGPADSIHSENQRWVSSGLAVVLGPFAAHRLYLGTTPKVAIIYGATFGGFGILVLLDLAHLLFTKDLDAYRNSDRVFMWTTEPGPTPP